MASIRHNFNKIGFDQAPYNRYFHRYQQEYIRKRLRMINAFAQGETSYTIAQQLGEHVNTVRKYLRTWHRALRGSVSLSPASSPPA